jgi:hypothetical protein
MKSYPIIALALLTASLAAGCGAPGPVATPQVVPVAVTAQVNVAPTDAPVVAPPDADPEPDAVEDDGQPAPEPAGDGPAGPIAGSCPSGPQAVTLTGTVIEVIYGDDSFRLAGASHGYDGVFLPEGSVVLSPEGAQATLVDIQPGMVVEACGEPGLNTWLIGYQVRMLPGELQPIPTRVPGGHIPLDAGDPAATLMAALNGRDYKQVEAMMGNPFIIGYWGSEGVTLSPLDAVEQLRRNLLPASGQLPYTLDPAQFPLLAGTPLSQLWGPDVSVALSIYSQGWGPDGNDEAILTIANGPDGSVYWHGLVYGRFGF